VEVLVEVVQDTAEHLGSVQLARDLLAELVVLMVVPEVVAPAA
jgi:hypothetical protein